MAEAEEQARSAVGAKCPYCQTKIKRGELVKICPHCGLPHHWECWRENGGCTTYGCEGTLQDRGVDPAAAARRVVTGDEPATRVCRQCGERYPFRDVLCPYCGTRRVAELLVTYATSMASQVAFALALVAVAALAVAVVMRLGVLFYITAPGSVALTLLSMLLYRRRYFCTGCRRSFNRASLFRPKQCPHCRVFFPHPPITKQN